MIHNTTTYSIHCIPSYVLFIKSLLIILYMCYTITKSINFFPILTIHYILKGDGMLDIWDCSSPLRPSVKINAHQAEILSCSWNQFYPFVLATGGAEGLIRIWDIRKLLTPIFQLEVGIDAWFYTRFTYDKKRYKFVTTITRFLKKY